MKHLYIDIYLYLSIYLSIYLSKDIKSIKKLDSFFKIFRVMHLPIHFNIISSKEAVFQTVLLYH